MITGGCAENGFVSALGGWLLSIGSSGLLSVILLYKSWIILNFYLFQILDTITSLGGHFPHFTEKLFSTEYWVTENQLRFSPLFLSLICHPLSLSDWAEILFSSFSGCFTPVQNRAPQVST